MIDALRVPDNIFVVRVSKLKLRLAKLKNDGSGYLSGLTNIRELEFISSPLSRAEMIAALKEQNCTPDRFDPLDRFINRPHHPESQAVRQEREEDEDEELNK